MQKEIKVEEDEVLKSLDRIREIKSAKADPSIGNRVYRRQVEKAWRKERMRTEFER